MRRSVKECQSIRRALIEVIGPNGEPLNLGKLRVEFDTAADDCMMTHSCYQQLKERLKFQNGEVEITGATEGQTTMTKYVDLNLNIGSIHFPPGIQFWVNETLTEDAGFDVLLSGPFLAHHNVIYIDPKLQREIEKDGKFDLKIQKHFDFPSVNPKMSKQGTSSGIFSNFSLPWTDQADSSLNREKEQESVLLIPDPSVHELASVI